MITICVQVTHIVDAEELTPPLLHNTLAAIVTTHTNITPGGIFV